MLAETNKPEPTLNAVWAGRSSGAAIGEEPDWPKESFCRVAEGTLPEIAPWDGAIEDICSATKIRHKS